MLETEMWQSVSLRSAALGLPGFGLTSFLSFKPSLFLVLLGGRDVELCTSEEKKKVYFLDLKADCAHKKNTFFPVFVHFCSPKPPAAINQVRSMWNSEKLMGCDFSMLFSCTMQKYAPSSIQICIYI